MSTGDDRKETKALADHRKSTESDDVDSEMGNRREELGYGRPPREYQFKPGKSGNPRGRPKGAMSLRATAEAYLSQRVSVRKGSRIHRMTRLKMFMEVFGGEAGKGNLRALKGILALAEKFNVGGNSAPPSQASPSQMVSAREEVERMLEAMERNFQRDEKA